MLPPSPVLLLLTRWQIRRLIWLLPLFPHTRLFLIPSAKKKSPCVKRVRVRAQRERLKYLVSGPDRPDFALPSSSLLFVRVFLVCKAAREVSWGSRTVFVLCGLAHTAVRAAATEKSPFIFFGSSSFWQPRVCGGYLFSVVVHSVCGIPADSAETSFTFWGVVSFT